MQARECVNVSCLTIYLALGITPEVKYMRIERSGRSAGYAGHQDSGHDIRTQMLHYAYESRRICKFWNGRYAASDSRIDVSDSHDCDSHISVNLSHRHEPVQSLGAWLQYEQGTLRQWQREPGRPGKPRFRSCREREAV